MVDWYYTFSILPLGVYPSPQSIYNVDSYSALLIFGSTHPYGLGAVDAGRIHPKISGDIGTRNRRGHRVTSSDVMNFSGVRWPKSLFLNLRVMIDLISMISP